jgi:hypothetical protein
MAASHEDLVQVLVAWGHDKGTVSASLKGPNLAKGDFLAKSGRSRATIGRASA